MIPRKLFRLSLRFPFARFIRIVQQDDVAEAEMKTFYDILRYLCCLAVETDGVKAYRGFRKLRLGTKLMGI